MKRAFAAWLTSASIASVTKSMNMISTTGLSPLIAAPTAAETMVASEIGVSRTRSGPKVSSRPRVALNDPPAAADVLAEHDHPIVGAHARRRAPG